jgi:hypothetical protein
MQGARQTWVSAIVLAFLCHPADSTLASSDRKDHTCPPTGVPTGLRERSIRRLARGAPAAAWPASTLPARIANWRRIGPVQRDVLLPRSFAHESAEPRQILLDLPVSTVVGYWLVPQARFLPW